MRVGCAGAVLYEVLPEAHVEVVLVQVDVRQWALRVVHVQLPSCSHLAPLGARGLAGGHDARPQRMSDRISFRVQLLAHTKHNTKMSHLRRLNGLRRKWAVAAL